MEKLGIANAQIKAAHNGVEQDYQALVAKLNGKESDLQERLGEINKKRFDPDRANLDAVDDDVVEINAGGKIVAAKRSVLTQLRGTRLDALFGGRWEKELQRDGHGRIFIDVNSVCFQAILDYLNEVAISSEDNPPNPPVVDDEHKAILHQYLKLFGMCAPKMPDSNIIKMAKDAKRLHDWLEEDGSDGDFRLLYRSSRDGLTNASFHSRCDDQGRTLTIIETADGYVLGGYSNTPWASSGGGRTANKAFLFVLSGSDVSSPHKMKLKNANDGEAVYHCSEGLIFGGDVKFFAINNRVESNGGHDIYVHGSDSKVYLNFGYTYESGPSGQLIRKDEGNHAIFAIKEMEVFKVSGEYSPAIAIAAQGQTHGDIPSFEPVARFSEDVNKAINSKQESLVQAEAEMLHLEESFEDKNKFIAAFAAGETKDVITLSVSGTVMAAKRSTLQAIEDSVLAQQFDDAKWTDQGQNSRCVKKWSPQDVASWAKGIDDISDDVASIFVDNDITGNELLALEKDGLMMLGITRAGTLFLLLKEIKILSQASQDVATLIEHSPYCFGKILDYLRLKQFHSQGLVKGLALPQVCDSQQGRFEKVVRYYFPGDCAKLILG